MPIIAAYAQGERDLYHATVQVSSTPLTSVVNYGPVPAHERALAPAA